MTYTPAMPPRAHQREYLERSAGKRSFANLIDLGCGKTFSELSVWGLLEDAGEVNDLLWISPAGCIANLTQDRGEPNDPLYRPCELRKSLDPATFERLVYAPMVSGANKGQRERVERLLAATGDHRRPRFLSINVEALSTVRAAREAARAFLSAPGRRSMVIVDEATCMGGTGSERTKQLLKLAELADYKRIMSGDLSPNSPLRVFSPFEFLNWRILGHRNWFSFKTRYAVEKEIVVGAEETPIFDLELHGRTSDRKLYWIDGQAYAKMGGAKRKIIVGCRNVEEIQERIAPHSFRVLKEDCLDLPPKTYVVRDLDMVPEQRRVYREMREIATARLDAEGHHATASSVVTQMMKLQGVLCGFVRDDEGVVRPVPTPLVDAIMGDLREHRGKAIVWCGFRQLLADVRGRVRKEFGEESVAEFHGGNQGQRVDDEARFLTSPGCRFMLATQAAGGRGNTWVNADLALYASNTQDAEHRRQSEERFYRDGQTRPVTVIDYVFPSTVSEKILHATRAKMDLSALVHGDDPRAWVV